MLVLTTKRVTGLVSRVTRFNYHETCGNKAVPRPSGHEANLEFQLCILASGFRHVNQRHGLSVVDTRGVCPRNGVRADQIATASIFLIAAR